MRAQYKAWLRAKQGAAELLEKRASARSYRRGAKQPGRPPAGAWPKRVLAVLKRYRRHDIPAPIGRSHAARLLKDLRSDIAAGRSTRQLLDAMDDALHQLRG